MTKLMRIGAFSDQTGLPISTVRYYVKLGLIVPSKPNGQFLFDEHCIADAERIKLWKSLRFSLEEIHELISIHRKYPNSFVKQENEYKQYFMNKKEELIQLKTQNEESLHRVETMLHHLMSDPRIHMDE
ncbi:MAG: MerR family transcriptional regulator [Eubacteriales bacterium]|nr:MerR family transcriptional regulator [Eubacteriales bacterium]